MSEHGEVRKIIPSLAWYTPFEPLAYAFTRFCTGAILVSHGVYRTFFGGSAAELGYLAHLPVSAIGVFELVGGAFIVLGLLTRPVALLFFIEWLCAALAVRVPPGASWFMLGATPHYPAMVAAFCFAFLLCGGGYYSLDRLIGMEL